MLIYVIDHDSNELKKYEEIFKRTQKSGEYRLFTDSVQAWNECQNITPDIVFVEYESKDYKVTVGRINDRYSNVKVVVAVSGKEFNMRDFALSIYDVVYKNNLAAGIKRIMFDMKHPILSRWKNGNKPQKL